MKHTPAPWQVRRTASIGSPAFHIICAGAAVPAVASTMPYGRSAEEEAANAQLIAAAPDLLAALRALLGDLPELWGDRVHGGRIGLALDAHAVEAALAAIAKATQR